MLLFAVARLAILSFCRFHRSVVASTEGVPANGGKFLEHLEAVFQVAHAGALVVSPGDRNLDDPIAVLDGDEQNLRVKAPVLDGLELKHSLRCPASECLEAALGVGEGQVHDGAGNGVEAAAEELAVERLALRLAVGLEPAGANGDVRALANGVKEAFGLLDGRREVGVGEENHIAPRRQHSGAHAVAFAAVAGVLEQAQFYRAAIIRQALNRTAHNQPILS